MTPTPAVSSELDDVEWLLNFTRGKGDAGDYERFERIAARISSLEAGLRKLAGREAAYREAHDVCGDGDAETGRRWDKMRRAGDEARTLLNRIDGA